MFTRDINLSCFISLSDFIELNALDLIIDSGPNTIQNKKWKIGFIRPLTLFALFSYQLAPKPLYILSCQNKRYFTYLFGPKY